MKRAPAEAAAPVLAVIDFGRAGRFIARDRRAMHPSRFHHAPVAVVLLAFVAVLLAGCGSLTGRSRAERSLSETQTRYARVGTNRVYYASVGRAPPTIVFVHGWAGHGGVWREQVPVLATRARLILIDLPGHGQSDQPPVDYTLDFLARAVVAVLTDARVDRAVLVGHSMGAAVICRVYAQAPEKVAALVAVEGALRRPALTQEQIERWVGPYRTPEYREHATRFIHSMFPRPGTEALRDEVCAEMLRTPPHVMRSTLENLVDPAQPDWDLKRVEVPVAVLNAPNPRWTADYEDYVRSLSPRTAYRIIDGAGHFLMLEKPAAFNAALLAVLRQFELIAR